MAPKLDAQSASNVVAADATAQFSMDPFFHVLKLVPYSFLRPLRLRLKLPSFSLPSAMTVFSLILLTYFLVVSGFIYDVIVEPPALALPKTLPPAPSDLSSSFRAESTVSTSSKDSPPVSCLCLVALGLCSWILPFIKTGLRVSRFRTQLRGSSPLLSPM
ncbi:CG9662 protein [Hibiscus syriacus]|uniref:CG9662 protein n=1 Tax=Hibiscus syriacus TaxID=106335 RepID=A0A6A2WIA0_HIBSY|nr:CG9662 protein [Hibiscus syriacus]